MLNLSSQREKMVEDKSPEHQSLHHYGHVAKHRREAANHHKAGDEKAAHHSTVAHGQHLHAAEHHERASKGTLSSTAKKAQRSRP